MKILALEFSSLQRSVAVLNNLQGSASSPPRKDRALTKQCPPGEIAEVIETGKAMGPLSMVEAALKQAGIEREQIECLAIGLGPGSYTGIRAAIALAQGWQLASEGAVKFIGINSAECIVAQAQADGFTGKLCVVIDAQREEFYLAEYEMSGSESREMVPLRLAPLAEVREREHKGDVLLGPEATRWFPKARVVFPRAATLGRLALAQKEFVSADKLEPVYLRETKFVKAPPPRVIS
jgi:tRNA threonylcarbamoyl adenosine modification protein YeaZ